MSFLDAAIGFAVVMAVLAGAITAFVEAIWRLARIRKGNVISVLKQLDTAMAGVEGANAGSEERWDLFCEILNNPMRTGIASSESGLPRSEDLKSGGTLPRRFMSKLALWKSPKLAGDDTNGQSVCDAAISALGRENALAGMFDKVSAEHVARRYAEMYVLTDRNLDNAREYIDKVIRNFESISSCMSAEFKRRSQLISIIVGIFVALAFNINGLRILDTFIAKPEVSKMFVTNLDQTEAQVLGQIESASKELSKTMDEADKEDGAASSTVTELNSVVEDLKSTVTGLSDRGVPLGWNYRPHCSLIESVTCFAVPERDNRMAIADVFLMVLSGVLIGLGAPFWFDVAKRLAAVRQMFSGTASDLHTKSGKDANGSSEERKKIVDDIVNSVGTEKTMNLFKDYFNVPDGSKLEFRVTDTKQKVRCRADLVDENRRVADWVSADIKDDDGAEFSTLSSGGFYVHTLDLTFEQDDTATVSIKIVDSNGKEYGEPWIFEVKSKKEKTHTASTTIMMG
jgi:hypothetical protein